MNNKINLLSNSFFLVPILLSILFKTYFMIIFLSLAICGSFIYHYHHEKKFLYVDMIFSFLLMFANIYLCYLSRFRFPYFQIAIIFVIVAFYFWQKAEKNKTEKRKYNLYHLLWHLVSTIITIVCMLGYGMN